METKDNKASSNEKLYMALAGIFFLSTVVLGYMLFQEKETVQLYSQENAQLDTEKQAVENELQDMLMEYEAMETENVEMQAEINEQKAKIEDLIKKAKDNNWTISKLKKEAESLREIMKGFVETIDSLNTANQELIAKNIQVNKQLQNKEDEVSELSKQKKELAGKVAIGSKIEAMDITATAQRLKKNEVARETTRANRAEQIKCCFTMNDNPIAKSGRKIVHLRIIDPTGKVLAEADNKENMFKFEGVEGLFSAEYEIIYENDELDVCMFWEKKVEGMELAAGIYLVEIYIDDYLAGKTKIELL
jgi:peptidoglycan hydrolase CwlO-like protein